MTMQSSEHGSVYGTNNMKKTPLKRTPWKKKPSKPLKRTKLKLVGQSTVAEQKREIQSLLRQIVILRDGKCILYGIKCGHIVGMEGVVWQAEHLIERSNSATYADHRLVVLVCRNCHGWKHFKKSNHDQYDAWVRTRLSKDRVELWDRCREESWRTSKVDWKLELAVLKSELQKLKLALYEK